MVDIGVLPTGICSDRAVLHAIATDECNILDFASCIFQCCRSKILQCEVCKVGKAFDEPKTVFGVFKLAFNRCSRSNTGAEVRMRARNEYRKFKIRSSTNDDLKSMQEVLTRRLKHSEWDYPDLIILDGGKTQVNAILPLVAPHHIPVIGRDKSGNHAKTAGVTLVLPNTDESTTAFSQIELPSGSHIARLIARIDEEAHRFAITYHSLLKRKSMLK